MRNVLSAIKEKIANFLQFCGKLAARFANLCDEKPIVRNVAKAVYYGVSFCWVVPAVVGSCVAMINNATILEDLVWLSAGGLMFAWAGPAGLWFVVLLPCFFGWLANTLLVIEWVVTEALRVEPCSSEEV